MTTTFGGLIGHGARGDLHTAGRFCNDFLIAADKTDFLELNWFWVSLLQLNLTNPSKNLDSMLDRGLGMELGNLQSNMMYDSG